MLLEMHVHSRRHSECSYAEPVELVRQALKKHLQGIVLTEHQYLWPEEELAELKAEAEVPGHFLIMAGQEVETDIGHVLVYGAGRTISGRREIERLRRDFPDAALVWAHPFLHGKVPDEEALLNPLIDAVEIFNLNHLPKENFRGLKLWHRFRFPATAGSDAHSRKQVGLFPTQFDHPIRTMPELVAELKAGRCRPFLKEIPSAGSHQLVTKITVGTKGEDEFRIRAVLKQFERKKNWNRAGETAEIVKAIYRRGFDKGFFRVPKIIDIDQEDRMIIEEGQRGSLLFDLMQYVNPSVGIQYFQLAAGWLARLHNLKLRIREPDRTAKKERRRFRSYLEKFRQSGSPHLGRAERLLELIAKREERLFAEAAESFIQVHGDYHPKNIIIGQDRSHDFSTLFVSVVDFDSSILFRPAFDVGYFLSQFEYQFRHHPRVRERYGAETFIDAYLREAKDIPGGFEKEVAFFRARANLNIAAYLNKMGKGESEEMKHLLAFSESLLQ